MHAAIFTITEVLAKKSAKHHRKLAVRANLEKRYADAEEEVLKAEAIERRVRELARLRELSLAELGDAIR